MKPRLTGAITLAALSLALAHASCVQEDLSGCVPVSNVALDFYLVGESRATPAFAAAIQAVDVLVLDSAGGLFHHARVEQADLAARQGMDLSLPAGRYRLTCWANSGDNTLVNGIPNPLVSGKVTYSTILPGELVGDSDKLYRAPAAAAAKQTFSGGDTGVDGLLTIDVPASGDLQRDVDFYPFHHVVEATITGYSTTDPPVIEITGIPAGAEIVPGTSLVDNLVKSVVTTSKQATVQANAAVPTSLSTIITFPFDLDDPDVHVRVLHPVTGAVLYDNSITDIIDPSTIPADPLARVTIRLHIEFIDATVTVTVQGWGTQPVNPV